MQRHHILSTMMQMACAAVITQTTPHSQYLILPRCGQVTDRGKALQKPGIVVQDGGDLGLLKHDFRQPDAVGVARVLPGQAVAPMCFLPAHNFRSKS